MRLDLELRLQEGYRKAPGKLQEGSMKAPGRLQIGSRKPPGKLQEGSRKAPGRLPESRRHTYPSTRMLKRFGNLKPPRHLKITKSQAADAKAIAYISHRGTAECGHRACTSEVMMPILAYVEA